MELGKKSVVVMIDYATNNNVRSKNNSSGGKIMHYLFFPKSLVCSETFCLFCFPFVEPGLKVCPQKKGYPPDEVLKRADFWARTETVRILSSLRMRRQKKIYTYMPSAYLGGRIDKFRLPSPQLSRRESGPRRTERREGGDVPSPPPLPFREFTKKTSFFYQYSNSPAFPLLGFSVRPCVRRI